MFPRSTSATPAPSSRARRAAVTPAGPPPITTTSNTVRPALASLPARRPQPQRDVPRLHRLMHDRNQLTTKPVEVSLLAQCGRESRERLDGIVLASVEAAVDKALGASPEGVEEGCYEKRGGHDRELRFAPGERT